MRVGSQHLTHNTHLSKLLNSRFTSPNVESNNIKWRKTARIGSSLHARGERQLLQRIPMSDNTIRLRPKKASFRESHSGPPQALSSLQEPRGEIYLKSMSHLPRDPSSLCPQGLEASQQAFVMMEVGGGTKLDNHMHVLEAPQGVGSARSEKTGWKRMLPASPPSGLEGLRLGFGLLGHYEGLIVRKGNTTSHLTAY